MGPLGTHLSRLPRSYVATFLLAAAAVATSRPAAAQDRAQAEAQAQAQGGYPGQVQGQGAYQGEAQGPRYDARDRYEGRERFDGRERPAAKAARLMSEPGEVTNVVDAFDEDNPFDLHFTLGFQQSWKRANIRRESTIGGDVANNPGLSSGGYTNGNMNVASYAETTSRLNTRVDIGIWHDIALYLRMPIILSNNRQLDDLDGSAKQQGVVLQGNPGEQLFSLPFRAPQRSGIDYLAVGTDIAITNQARDRTKPTWVIGGEARFSVGEPMHACNDSPPGATATAPKQVRCAHPSDINRNGVAGDVLDADGRSLEGAFSGDRPPGVSRGTTALEGHTFVSRRIKYVEPYAGFRALVEFAQERSDFGATDLKGSVVNHFPLQGWMIFGMQVIPWEHREEFQRLTIDFRFTGAYRSEGRDYSELFDALGSSSANSLRSPSWTGYRANPDPTTAARLPSVVDPGSQKIYFTGITDVQGYGTFQASTSVTWQAAEYVKFQVGVAYTREQSHIITADQPCNPDFSGGVQTSGPCRTQRSVSTPLGSATGAPNPNYRASVDLPGRRFRTDDSSLWDAWLNAVVMF